MQQEKAPYAKRSYIVRYISGRPMKYHNLLSFLIEDGLIALLGIAHSSERESKKNHTPHTTLAVRRAPVRDLSSKCR